MTRDIKIPPEVEVAVAKAIFGPGGLSGGMREVHRHTARAAILAALKEWPGMSDIPSCEADGTRYPRVIHLPINTENSNAWHQNPARGAGEGCEGASSSRQCAMGLVKRARKSLEA